MATDKLEKPLCVLITILAQKGTGVHCIYVAIGQKQSTVAGVVNTFMKHGAMDYTTVVAATAADPASEQYLAPYAGCAMANITATISNMRLSYMMTFQSMQLLIDKFSLLLRRPPGREAYPGDIFYLHAFLLERAAKLSDELGGGSLTALPIIETQLGDVSAYIPTNVISITDGQIYLESDLFFAGIRPAVNVSLSVSRVGGSAQIKAMKQVAGNLRIALAYYNDLQAFAQFASELDAATKAQLNRGVRLVEILKQPQFKPMTVEDQIMLIWTGSNGFLDELPVDRIRAFETEFLAFMHNRHGDVVKMIIDQQKFDDAITMHMTNATKEFLAEFKA